MYASVTEDFILGTIMNCLIEHKVQDVPQNGCVAIPDVS